MTLYEAVLRFVYEDCCSCFMQLFEVCLELFRRVFIVCSSFVVLMNNNQQLRIDTERLRLFHNATPNIFKISHHSYPQMGGFIDTIHHSSSTVLGFSCGVASSSFSA